jgi:hypothetical protein
VTQDPGLVRIGTAEREEAMTLLSRQFSEGRLNPLVALGFTILVPHGWLTWLALPILGILLYR